MLDVNISIRLVFIAILTLLCIWKAVCWHLRAPANVCTFPCYMINIIGTLVLQAKSRLLISRCKPWLAFALFTTPIYKILHRYLFVLKTIPICSTDDTITSTVRRTSSHFAADHVGLYS